VYEVILNSFATYQIIFMKVLVIRFSSIGDIVLTTPILRCLKEQKPESKIHYLTKSTFSDILSSNPYIDQFFLLDKSLRRVIKQLQEEQYDFIIDLHNNLRSFKVKQALEKPSFSFRKLNFRKWLLVNFKWHVMPDKSIVERYFDAVKPLGIKNDTKGLDFFISENNQLTRKDIPMSHWHGYIACVIGGSYFTKKLPVEQWKILLGHLPYPIILLGGSEDREMGEEISVRDTVRIYNSCGKFSINESADLVKNARVIISNDTGLMHIAAAFKKPIISLWGNTSPEMGMFPYYGYNNISERVSPISYIAENNNLSCRPCSKIGYSRCPKKHFKCMYDINMKDVAEKAIIFWKNTNLSFQNNV